MGDIPEGRLCITNDNPESTSIALKTIAIAFLVLGVVMVITPVCDYWSAAVKTPGHWANMAVFCPMGIGVVVLAFQIWFYAGLSTWKLDSEGIAFQGPRGGRRYLPWRDVERVRWSHEGVRVLGRGECIDLYWKQLKPETQTEAARTLRSYLGRDFGLPTPAGEVYKWSDVCVAILKTALCFLWVFGSLFITKHVSVLLVSALLPAVPPLVKPLLRDGTVQNYTAIAFYLAVLGMLLSPMLILIRNSQWLDRRVN